MKKKLLLLVLVGLIVGGVFNASKNDSNIIEFWQQAFSESKVPQATHAALSPTKLLKPPPELQARLHPASDNLLSITSEWIPYYHRHPDEENIHRVIMVLLNNNAFSEHYFPFFVYLLQNNPEQLKEVKRSLTLSQADENANGVRLLKMVQGRQLKSVVEVDDFSTLWGIYAATGNNELLDVIFEHLAVALEGKDSKRGNNYSNMLFGMSQDFYPIYKQIGSLADRSEGSLRVRLQEISSKAYDYSYKKANHYLSLGKNFAKAKQYPKALNSYMQGLQATTDYPYLYKEVGALFRKSALLDNAKACLYRAQSALPQEDVNDVRYEMAMVAHDRGDFTKALTIFQEAHSSAPEEPIWVGNLAWIAEKTGNIDLTARYYKMLLKMEGSITTKQYALTYLQRHKQDIPELDTGVKSLFTYEKFAELDVELERLLASRELDADGRLKSRLAMEELLIPSHRVDHIFNAYFELYNEWLEHSPNSHFAHAGIGALYINYAWQARGVGFAGTITSEASKLFQERLKQAAKSLTKAYELKPKNSFVATKMMTVAKVSSGWPETEVKLWFERAVEAEPTDLVSYQAMENFLLPKWGGSFKECLAFAREAVKNSPKDSMVPAILPQVHWGIYLTEDNKDYFKDPKIWTEVKAVYDELSKRFPESQERHNWFARTACLAEDYTTAQGEFDLIGENWHKDVWNSKENFLYYRNLAARHTN